MKQKIVNTIHIDYFNNYVELQLMWHLESIQKAIDTLKC